MYLHFLWDHLHNTNIPIGLGIHDLAESSAEMREYHHYRHPQSINIKVQIDLLPSIDIQYFFFTYFNCFCFRIIIIHGVHEKSYIFEFSIMELQQGKLLFKYKVGNQWKKNHLILLMMILTRTGWLIMISSTNSEIDSFSHFTRAWWVFCCFKKSNTIFEHSSSSIFLLQTLTQLFQLIIKSLILIKYYTFSTKEKTYADCLRRISTKTVVDSCGSFWASIM